MAVLYCLARLSSSLFSLQSARSLLALFSCPPVSSVHQETKEESDGYAGGETPHTTLYLAPFVDSFLRFFLHPLAVAESL